MFAQFARWLSPSRTIDQSHRLYIALVGQARQPIFYAGYGVPDSLDGRFEMILLHLFLLSRRLQGENMMDATMVSQEMTDIFFSDMDRSLREIGVGDMSVGKKMKKMGAAYNGRLTVYTDAVGELDTLKEALRRNVYGTTEPDNEQVAKLADYLLRAQEALASQSAASLLNAEIVWPTA